MISSGFTTLRHLPVRTCFFLGFLSLSLYVYTQRRIFVCVLGKSVLYNIDIFKVCAFNIFYVCVGTAADKSVRA